MAREPLWEGMLPEDSIPCIYDNVPRYVTRSMVRNERITPTFEMRRSHQVAIIRTPHRPVTRASKKAASKRKAILSGQNRNKASGSTSNSEPDPGHLDCSICMEPCLYPTILPCSHVFCYLCIKGAVRTAPHANCPLCRASISEMYMDCPMLTLSASVEIGATSMEEYSWFYETKSKTGWWKYDPRTNAEIERAAANHQRTVDVLVCGETFIVDLERGLQYPYSDRGNAERTRLIKRAIGKHLKVIGISGIPFPG